MTETETAYRALALQISCHAVNKCPDAAAARARMAESIARMKRVLGMTVIEGIKTSIPLHLKILNDPDFVAGRMSTHFMERFMPPAKPSRLAESA